MERFLADSNRRTRFCRPLTKPLIQGTISFSIALAKVVIFFFLPNFAEPFFNNIFYFLVWQEHLSLVFSEFKLQLLQLEQGLSPFFCLFLKRITLPTTK